jgi:hypothetical protein
MCYYDKIRCFCGVSGWSQIQKRCEDAKNTENPCKLKRIHKHIYGCSKHNATAFSSHDAKENDKKIGTNPSLTLGRFQSHDATILTFN